MATRWLTLSNLSRTAPPHTVAGRIVTLEIRKALFNLQVSPFQGIVVGVRNHRPIIGMVIAVVIGNFRGQTRQLFCCLLFGQRLDRNALGRCHPDP